MQAQRRFREGVSSPGHLATGPDVPCCPYPKPLRRRVRYCVHPEVSPGPRTSRTPRQPPMRTSCWEETRSLRPLGRVVSVGALGGEGSRACAWPGKAMVANRQSALRAPPPALARPVMLWCGAEQPFHPASPAPVWPGFCRSLRPSRRPALVAAGGRSGGCCGRDIRHCTADRTPPRDQPWCLTTYSGWPDAPPATGRRRSRCDRNPVSRPLKSLCSIASDVLGQSSAIEAVHPSGGRGSTDGPALLQDQGQARGSFERARSGRMAGPWWDSRCPPVAWARVIGGRAPAGRWPAPASHATGAAVSAGVAVHLCETNGGCASFEFSELARAAAGKYRRRRCVRRLVQPPTISVLPASRVGDESMAVSGTVINHRNVLSRRVEYFPVPRSKIQHKNNTTAAASRWGCFAGMGTSSADFVAWRLVREAWLLRRC